jgi:hypothetical protein
MSFLRKIALAVVGLMSSFTIAKADIADGQFSTNQIFDVQYYWSGTTLNASSFIAPYDMNFTHPTVSSGQYFQFFNSTTNPGTYGLGLYNSDGTLAQVVHNTGTLQAIGPDALFYIGSGFFGTVITTSAGYSYGDNASFTNMDTSVSGTDTSSYTWASTTPLAAGQTAGSGGSGSGSGGSSNYVSNPTNMNFATNDLTGWTSGGGTGNQTSTYTGTGVGVDVVQGMQNFNAGGSHSWTITPPTGDYMVSIQPTGQQQTGTNDFQTMATALNLSATSVTQIQNAMTASGNGLPTNAAWLYQDLVLANGTTFNVAWQYVSSDYEPFNDGSLTSLVNTTGTVVATVNGENKEYALLGFTNAGTGNYSVGSYGATGWQLATYLVNENGTYRLGFGSFNLSDTALSPILFVTQYQGTTLDHGVAFGPIAPNAGSSAPNNSGGGGSGGGGSPTIVSTAPGADIVTSSSTVGATVDQDTVNYTAATSGDTKTITQTTITAHTTPTTTVTVITPTTVDTYSDGSTVTTNGTPVTTTTTVNTITFNQAEVVKTAHVGGGKDAYNNTIVKPFFVDPFGISDGSWADVSLSSGNNIGSTNVNFGYQKTVDNITAGVAGSAGKVASSGLNNSSVTGETYAGTAYVLNKSDLVNVKGSIGFGIGNYVVDNSIASFGLSNKTKSQQKTAYADMAFYSAKDYAGWTPFAGVTVLNSDIGNVEETGTSLLSSGTVASNKTYTMPYVGVKNEVSPGVVVEVKATQTEPYGTVVSGKVTAKNKITDNVSLNLTVGADKGQNYDSLAVMLGLVVNF